MVDGKRIRRRLVELVQVPSLTGDEGKAIDLIHSWLKDLQGRASHDVEVDRWTDIMSALELDPAYPGREVDRAEVPVVAARVRGDRPGRSIVLTGHVDVVPPGDRSQWSHPPFSAQIEDGDRLYGRGACDMKSGVIAALEVFETVALGQRDFPGELLFVAVPGEEDGGTGTLSAIRRGWVGDCVIITEPTSGGSLAGDNAPDEGLVEQAQPDEDAQPAVVVAHAGALTFTLTVKGRSAHASKRLQGQSALEHFMTVHDAMRADEQAINDAEDHPYLRALGLPYPTNVGVVRGGEWSSSVMDHLEAEVRTGVALGETPEQAEFRFREAVADVGKESPWLQANPVRVERTGAVFGAAEVDVAHPLVRTLRRAAAGEFGGAPRLAAAPFGCDMRLWVNEAGAATVVYGPGDIRLAHAPNEWVSLRETERVARVLLETCSRMMVAEDGG